MQREPCSPEGVRPWPVAPRPFDDEALGGWLGRLAARYQISVDQLWQIGDLGAFPALTNTGWLLFPPMDPQALCRLALLTHIGIPRLKALQTPMAWVSDRDQLPYCFDCLVLNPVDVFSPRWKRDWLDPHTAVCQVPGHRLNTLPPCTLRICHNLTAVLRAISKRQRKGRQKRSDLDIGGNCDRHWRK
ncbi:TniQ family protein [Cupriavidus necator]|uniref:TniQ family protein n=1 Tax=Cupriavidus necator TaxID=106590 RepID=UPI0039C08DF5